MVHIRLEEIEKYASRNNVPIMQKDGIEFLTKYIKENNIKKILEIGSAIGYSAIKMALVDKEVFITTIERDKERYDIAIKNINDFSLNNQIEIINDDAFNVELDGVYDLIFIDAAKAQYIKFFEKFEKNLSNDGVIISDNLDFHGLTKDINSIKSRNLKQLVRKINKFVDYLKENEKFDTIFYDIGDGVAISTRKR
jgi:predicted O-methyltransferase YrrM